MTNRKLRRRLIASAVLLVAIVALFYVSSTRDSQLIGNIPHSELLDNLFVQPDGSSCTAPCMFGVYIGKTKPDDIPSILRSHPYIIKHFLASDFAQPYSDYKWFKATTSDFGFDFSGDNTKVSGAEIGGKSVPYQWLKIIPSQEMPTLGQIILALGTPPHIRFTQLPRNGQFDKEFFYVVKLDYLQKGLEISFNYLPDAEMKPDDRPTDMYIFALDDYPANVNEGGSWHGFQSIQAYINVWVGDVDVPQ